MYIVQEILQDVQLNLIVEIYLLLEYLFWYELFFVLFQIISMELLVDDSIVFELFQLVHLLVRPEVEE